VQSLLGPIDASKIAGFTIEERKLTLNPVCYGQVFSPCIALAVSLPLRQIVSMNNPWKWLALGLGAALIILAVFTILIVYGVLDFGLSVI
jgi:hypothetical protein